MPTIPEVLGLLARAADVTHGMMSVFDRIGPSIEATRMALEYADASKAPVVWRDRASLGVTLPVTPWQWPVAATSGVLATLVVHREQPFRPSDHQHFSAIADAFAIALARDAQLVELQLALTAQVQEVAHQRAFMECVVDSFPDGLYVIDRDYRINAWNHKRETGMQGVSRTAAIGRTIFEVLHRQPAALLKREFDEVFASGRLQQFQMESTASGETRSYRISKIPMRMGGGPVTHVITIGQDVTDWKAALDWTAQSEKLAALGQLATGVMHEINNPLAAIAACAESMSLQIEVGDTATPSTELLRIIDLEVQRCKSIVNGLLDFARPKPSHRELFDVNEVVRQSMLLLQHHPRFNLVRLVVELADSGHALAFGDAAQLVQVLIALAMNAFDATPDGGRVLIRTSSALADDGRRLAVLEVHDEGPGIPRAMQGRVFEPFFTSTPRGQGTGLGLAIYYGMVRDHGGELELVAPEGTGAVFRVSLPAGAPQ